MKNGEATLVEPSGSGSLADSAMSCDRGSRGLSFYRYEGQDLAEGAKPAQLAPPVIPAAVETPDEFETPAEFCREARSSHSAHANDDGPPAELDPVAGRRQCKAARKRKRIQWTDELDLEIAKRWFAFQHHTGIAADMGLPEAAVRTRATRLGLPPRDRKLVVQDFVEGRPYDRGLEESVVRRRCKQGNVFFWGKRNGPHTSPKVMQTKRYKTLRRGMADVSLHL